MFYKFFVIFVSVLQVLVCFGKFFLFWYGLVGFGPFFSVLVWFGKFWSVFDFFCFCFGLVWSVLVSFEFFISVLICLVGSGLFWLMFFSFFQFW